MIMIKLSKTTVLLMIFGIFLFVYGLFFLLCFQSVSNLDYTVYVNIPYT